jgi:hypothetical protein
MVPPPRKRIFLKKKRGWSKALPATIRRKKVFSSTNKAKSKHNQYLEAFHAMQGLANLSKDPATKKEARADAEYFSKKLEKYK